MVKLRPLRPEDALRSVEWRNDPEVFKLTGNTYNTEITPEMECDWLERAIADPTTLRRAVIVDGYYVGNAHLSGIDTGVGEMHLFIGEKSRWGTGVGKEALRLLMEEGRKIGLKHFKGLVRVEHTASLALVKSIGMVAIGRQKNPGNSGGEVVVLKYDFPD